MLDADKVVKAPVDVVVAPIAILFNPVDVNVPIEVADTDTPNTFAVLLYNPVVEPLEVTIEGREEVPAEAVNTPVAPKVVNDPALAVVAPIVPVKSVALILPPA